MAMLNLSLNCASQHQEARLKNRHEVSIVPRRNKSRSPGCHSVLGFLLAIALCAIVPAVSARAADESSSIRLNSVGYLPRAEKKVSLAAPCTNFAVVRISDNSTVWAGKVTGPVLNPDTGESLYTADFSNVKKTGDYRIVVPGVGQSAPFHIAADVYREPYYTVTRGFYLWRCGTAVSGTCHGQTFAHAICHTKDAWLDYVGGGHARRDGAKGWHDAGDYNKYTVNAGVTMGVLFRAWEDFGPQLRKVRLDIPESGGKLPDFLAELKWEMDWLLTMQLPDGSVSHKLTAKNFSGNILPEEETAERYFTPWGSEATANFVAMLAQAARVFRPYDSEYAARCLQAAQKSYQFLQAHPEYHPANQSDFNTGLYGVNEPRSPQRQCPAKPALGGGGTLGNDGFA